MAYKDILVHLDSSPHCEARIALALNLAKQHKAHLTGLYVISHPHYAPQQEGAESTSKDVEATFLREAAKAGVPASWQLVDWAVTGVHMGEIINMYAYYKDLVIVGQAKHDAPVTDVPHDLPERVVLGSGRPVLVVPFAGTFNRVGECVVIAWHVGRETARAIYDAMPILENAQQVTVVEISTTTGETGDSVLGENLLTYLAHHSIQAKSEIIVADIPIGDALLNHAWENGCELLVMGAYGKSQLGALTVGAVAKNVLKHMTVPVLFSH